MQGMNLNSEDASTQQHHFFETQPRVEQAPLWRLQDGHAAAAAIRSNTPVPRSSAWLFTLSTLDLSPAACLHDDVVFNHMLPVPPNKTCAQIGQPLPPTVGSGDLFTAEPVRKPHAPYKNSGASGRTWPG